MAKFLFSSVLCSALTKAWD